VRPIAVLLTLPLLALAACGSSPPPAAFKACSELASWERSYDGSGTIQSSGEADALSADGEPSPAFSSAFARWMDDQAAVASDYDLDADVSAVNAVCAAAGVQDAVPEG
jgi:hypothetical protein